MKSQYSSKFEFFGSECILFTVFGKTAYSYLVNVICLPDIIWLKYGSCSVNKLCSSSMLKADNIGLLKVFCFPDIGEMD